MLLLLHAHFTDQWDVVFVVGRHLKTTKNPARADAGSQTLIVLRWKRSAKSLGVTRVLHSTLSVSIRLLYFTRVLHRL